MADNKVQIIIEALDKTKAAFQSLNKNFEALKKDLLDIRGNLQSAFQAAPFVAIAAAIKKTANAGDELLKVSQEIGVSVENLSGLKYAAEQSETSVEALTVGAGILSKTLASSADASNDAKEYLKLLGVNAKETYPALMQIADRFASMADGSGKTKIAMELFGRSGKDLIPFLNEGSSGIQRLQEEAKKLGIVFTEDGARAADNFNDTLKKLGDAFWGSIYPAVTIILPQLTDVLNNLTPSFKVFGGVAEWAVNIFKYWAVQLQKFGAEIFFIGKKISIIWDWVTSGFKGGSDKIKKEFAALNAELLAEYNAIEQKWVGIDLGKKKEKPSGSKGKAPTLPAKDTLRAALDAQLKAELEALKTAEAQRLEAYKTEEKNLELKYKQGLISEEEYIAEKNKIQASAMDLSIFYNEKEKQMISSAWEKKKTFFKAEKDRLTEEGNVKAEISKRDQEIAVKKEELVRLGIDLTIQETEYSKKLTEAKREGELKVLEAEINLRKTLNNLAVERGDMTSLEAKKTEKDYEVELLQKRKESLNLKLKDTAADSERLAIKSEILAIEKQISGAESERLQIEKEISGTFGQGMEQGFKKYLSELKTTFQQGEEIAKQTAQAMEGAFSDFFFDVFQGKLKTLADYLRGFLTSVQRALSQALGQQVTGSIVKGISGMFSGGGGADASIPGWSSQQGVNMPKAHEGGLIMHEGGYVPRFHFGALAYDEVPAILQRGERVMSRDQNAIFERLASLLNSRGDSGGGKQEVNNYYYINAVDAKSFADIVERNPGAITKVIDEDQRRGSTRWR